MHTSKRPFVVLAVPGLTLLLLAPAPSRGADAAPKEDVKKVRSFLDQVATVVGGDRQAVEQNLDALNQIRERLNAVVNNLDLKDPAAVEDAVNAATAYQDAIHKAEAAERELGSQVEKTEATYAQVEKREADGALPQGTLTKADKDQFKEAKVSLDGARQAVADARKESRQEGRDLADKGIIVSDVPAAGPGRPAGLMVVAGYLPKDLERSGFAVIRNFDEDNPHSGVLSLTIVQGSATPSIDGGGTVDVPKGGQQTVHFSFQDVKGDVMYKPDFRQTK